MKKFRIRVRGKVQGVFYRVHTQKKAAALGLSGFVKNEPDHSVYIEAEGERAALIQLFEWCKTGPDLARVEHVDYEETDLITGFKEFVIYR